MGKQVVYLNDGNSITQWLALVDRPCNHVVSPKLTTFICVDGPCPKQSSDNGEGGR